MKRIGGRIYERLTSRENLTAAFYEAARGKRNKNTYGTQVTEFEENLDANVRRLSKQLRSLTWRPHGTRKTERVEHGKLRKIIWFNNFEDLVVMHALHRTVGVLLEKKLIEDTYSGVKKRGIRKGMNRVRRWLAEYPDGTPVDILKWDFRHYYPSISVSRMKAKLARYIKDKYVLWLYGLFLDACPGELPIGSFLSQLLANIYLTDIDREAKRMGYRHYARYCDDGVVIAPDRESLKQFVAVLYRMAEEDGLEIKDNIQIFPIERHGLDFMGYVFHRHGLVRLRKRTERRFRHAVHVCKRENGSGNLVERVASYKGLILSLTWGEKLWMSVVGMEFKDFYKKYRKTDNANI
jgi:hypothetical protein